MCEKEKRDLIDFVMEEDAKFYEHYLSQLTEEELERFLEEGEEYAEIFSYNR